MLLLLLLHVSEATTKVVWSNFFLSLGCVRTDATTPTLLRQKCWELLNCVRAGSGVQTDATLLRYGSAITEQKKCWELLAEKCDRFQTLRNNTRQHPTTCNKVKRTQHVTSNNVGSCWPTVLRPFARGLRHQCLTANMTVGKPQSQFNLS